MSGKQPEGYPDASGEGVIQIMLGSESARPRYNEEKGVYESQRMYKSLKNILDEICSKVRPIIYDSNGNEIQQSQDASSSATGINEDNEKIDKTAKYGYVIRESEKETTVEFYYQDPNDQLKNQPNARVYTWLEHGQSIIKNLDIKSKTDFAMLNVQVATIDDDNGEMTLHVANGRPQNSEQQDSEVDYTVGNLKDVSEALNSQDFNAMFVTDIRNTQDYQVTNGRLSPQQAAAILARNVVHNLNQTVFAGTIDLPGDPFYLFDASVKPFSYLIKVLVKRPNYINSSGEFVAGELSYLSGLYAIKKITHKVSTSGYETSLDVMKWPRKNEDI